MLIYIFIGITTFVLMGIPVLVLITFVYGLIKVNSETKRQVNRTSKFLLPIPTVIRLAHHG